MLVASLSASQMQAPWSFPFLFVKFVLWSGKFIFVLWNILFFQGMYLCFVHFFVYLEILFVFCGIYFYFIFEILTPIGLQGHRTFTFCPHKYINTLFYVIQVLLKGHDLNVWMGIISSGWFHQAVHIPFAFLQTSSVDSLGWVFFFCSQRDCLVNVSSWCEELTHFITHFFYSSQAMGRGQRSGLACMNRTHIKASICRSPAVTLTCFAELGFFAWCCSGGMSYTNEQWGERPTRTGWNWHFRLLKYPRVFSFYKNAWKWPTGSCG